MNNLANEKIMLVYLLRALNNLITKPGIVDAIQSISGCATDFVTANVKVEKDIRLNVSSFDLTYNEAYSAMRIGFRVTHKSFSINEYHYMNNGVVYSESDEVVLGFEYLNNGWRVLL